MADTFLLEIVTPDRMLIREEVEEVVAPGVEGEFGVLPGHTPFLTLLKPGEVRFRKGKNVTHLSISGGYAEVDQKKVTILAETAELASRVKS